MLNLNAYKSRHQVLISEDGKDLKSSNGRDVAEAFETMKADEIIAPLQIVQREMQPIMSDRGDQTSDFPKPNSQLHMSNFIAPSTFKLDADGDDLVSAQLRRCALSAREDTGDDDVTIRSERSSTSGLLKWQVVPVLEARVFRCCRKETAVPS